MAEVIKYQIRSRGSNKWSGPMSLRKATRIAARRVGRRSGRYVVYDRDHPKATAVYRHNIRKARKVFRNKLNNLPKYSSAIWRIQSKNGFFVAAKKIVIHTISLAPEPSIGTTPLKQWHREVFGEVGGLVSWGIYNCRRIAGTWSYSQHAYSNAEDVHGSYAKMQEAFNYTVKNARRLNVRYAIFYRRIYKYQTGQVHPYYGYNPHTDHIHVEFNPAQYGGCRVVG